MTRHPVKPLAAAVLAACAVGPSQAALLSLSPTPLYVLTAKKADVLLIYSNSNAMDEDATGLAVGSAAPTSKSEISRIAARTLITNYTGQLNMGLMAYQQKDVAHDWLNPSTYDASFDPANYDPAWSGARDSTTHKKFKIPNPTSPNASGACVTSSGTQVDCVYFNVNLPYYSGTPAGNQFCYSGTNGSSSYVTFAGDHTKGYKCASTKTGTSDAAPGATGAGYGSTSGPYNFGPTDSDLAQAIDDFGQRLTAYDVGPAWFSNSSPGLGYLHVPIASLDSTQAGKLNMKLATSVLPTYDSNTGTWNDNPTSIVGGNTATNPNAPLQNAGLSPITGTFKTAKDYFNGATGSFDADQGGPTSAPPDSCGKDFAVFLTNGLPSVDSSGNSVASKYVPGQPYSASEVANAVSAVGALNSGTRPVKTYVIGFALPEFTNNYFVANPPNPLSQMATAGGTGAAYFANDLTTLNTTFSSIFSDIIKQSGSAAAVALTSGSVVAGGKIYQGQFNSVDWSGDLIAFDTNPTSGAVTTVAWNAGAVLNGQDYSAGRAIVTYKPSSGVGIPFRWPANPASPGATELDTSQTTALTSNPALSATNTSDTGQNRLDFLRGKNNIAGFRPRLLSVLGDIVNSAPVYVGAPAFNYLDGLETVSYSSYRAAKSTRAPMLYVGANDGMLHGFDAATGAEKIAYVPSKTYANLAQLTTTGYSHRYFVDGSPTVADTFYSNAWHTTLVSGLGAGGQGMFALDVSDPSTFSEANAASVVRWEYSDADLGYVGGQPSIVRLNTGEWAAVFGNGYNNSEADGSASTSGHAFLYVVRISDGTLIKKIDTGVGSAATPNALATPSLIDTDGDGDADYAYAGDLQGNVWKFDLCNANNTGKCASSASGWGVAFSGAALFTAKDASNNAQPITSAIEITRFFNGDGYQLYFGTGKYIEAGDLANTSQQTFYSLWDKADAPSVISGRSALQAQTVSTTTTVSGNTYRTTSNNAVAWDGLGGTQRGWYMDLPASGERVVGEPTLYNNRILFTTLIPDTVSCGGGSGWLMELDATTGSALTMPTFDVNNDGKVDSADSLSPSTDPAVYGSGLKQDSIPSSVKLQKNPNGPGGGTLLKPLSLSKNDPNAGAAGSLKTPINALGPTQKLTSWRQIF